MAKLIRLLVYIYAYKTNKAYVHHQDKIPTNASQFQIKLELLI